LRLADFRCYEALHLESDAEVVVLHGPNGAGKTNLLEALSFLGPGRGLRRARLGDVRRHGGAAGWSVAARLETPLGPADVGTGVPEPGARRQVRIDGATAPGPAALAEHLGVQWLTPGMDRLFQEGPAPRRRFLDRLVYGADPAHARRVQDYEKALRERGRLLREGRGDRLWLEALEHEMAALAIAIAAARRQAVARLEQALTEAQARFPPAQIAIAGELENWLETMPAVEAEARMTAVLAESRQRDGDTGGAAVGSHRSDLRVSHGTTGLAAETCSTGEQKALLIAIVLANARIEAARRGAPPLLLLDEVAAHLDAERREALYDEILALGAQAWLSGTEAGAFEPLRGRARFLAVRDASITVEE
jgi:DNA replication and repair protein RecF